MSLAVGLLLISGCISGGFASPVYKETRTVTVPHQPGMPVRVETANGSVSIRRGEGEQVTVQAEVRAQSEERLAEMRVVAERRDGTLVVEVDWPGGRVKGGEGCSFEITVPDANGVQVRSVNGSIVLVGLAGKADLDTSNGAITVTEHVGPAKATTSNGTIRVKEVGGALIARTSNGAVEVEKAKGPVEVQSSNGRVKVELAEENSGPVQIRTSNGGVDLVVGRAFAGQLNMSTSNGGVNFRAPAHAKEVLVRKDSAKLVIGESKAISEVHTSNGSIEFRMAEK